MRTLNGLRVIAILFVVLGHTYAFMPYGLAHQLDSLPTKLPIPPTHPPTHPPIHPPTCGDTVG